MSEHNITVEGGSSVRLKTAGKYCDRDIVVMSQGGTEDLNEVLTEQEALIAELQEILVKKAVGGGLVYDMGTFTVDADTQSTISIPHNLGAVPYFMMVWTDHWAGLTADTPNEYTTNTNVGVIFMRGLTGMTQRLTSAVNHTKPLQVWIAMPANDYRANMSVGTSPSYGITTYPTDTTLYLGRVANNAYWRSGVTYNYFVATPWWDKHE